MKAHVVFRWTSSRQARGILVLLTCVACGPLTGCQAGGAPDTGNLAAFATAEGPDREGGYEITLQLPEGDASGFLAAINDEGNLVEIGPRFDLGPSGKKTIYYRPSAHRPDLVETVQTIAAYAGEHRLYIRLDR